MSILGRLFRRNSPGAALNHALGMVMLGDAASFDTGAAFHYLTSHWSDLPGVVDVETQEMVTTAKIPGGSIQLLHMPMPIPRGDLEGPVALAWHWPDASAAVGAHQSHLIVHAASNSLDAIDVRLFHTKFLASALAVSRGVGVYMGNAMLVRSASDLRDDAQTASRENLPLLSWIGFNPVREDETFSAYTTGLAAFGLLELEVRRSKRDIPDLLGKLADVANYQLSSGAVLRDGDTFGETEFDRTSVRYGQSAFIPDTTVAALEIP
jgi:Domain of unknown function (DUF4261)